jgi:signal transduction histidine kinase
VQSLAPRLVRTLDRAVAYSQGVLAYGWTMEAPPSRRRLRLHQLVEDVHGVLGLAPDEGIVFVNEVDIDAEIDADAEQMFRVLANLCRNAAEAMAADEEPSLVKRLTVTAEREGAVMRVLVTDTGPGLPLKAKENLFTAFRGSARSGGTGLGLAIAQELVRAHGGSIELVESVSGRTVFSFVIPDRPVPLDTSRARSRRQA